ncbi:cell surface hyaluronidase-like [Pollicipes pollicipes]|uniref:cell surface hyaluronidase-like n=1 Tax=Pollicipes pollicipes TaxID=41117 RepID=UPI001885789B|nr:cell surface hyaluronidase-like [Pollicipes pollicipes]
MPLGHILGVVSPATVADELLLSASLIELDGGELWIGSEECPFESRAEVLLTGQRDEAEGAADVQKAVLVRRGALEVHGKPKRSWTKLAATVPKSTSEDLVDNPIYSIQDEKDLISNGFHMYEFDSDGNPVRNWGRVTGPSKYSRVLDHTDNVFVVAVSQMATFGSHDPVATAEVFESLCYGGERQSAIRSMVDRQRLAFVAICHVGSPENSVEMVGTANNGRSHTGRIVQTIGDVEFAAMSTVVLSGSDSPLPEMASYAAGTTPSMEVILTMTDDVSSWETGDRIVIASTDFNRNQEEEFDLLDCPSCDGTQVKIMGPIWYTHWGEITDGVDMRAEVGDLTRNVQFHGQMEDACYGSNLCDSFDYDTFGGHIKMLSGFNSARIENAEFYHMGQQPVIGSYPIHFHMCLDTSQKDVYIRGNAIHNTFSRCLTIHGTHNVTAENNVAFDHLGHCFFLEDGGEQDNRLIGNLGMGTKAGTLLPTDAVNKVSTFWVTNPDNEVINNVAAGSEGIGIWILMPDLPTGPSANVDMGLVEKQASRTLVKAFQGNVAHSNRRFGFRLDDELLSDGTVQPLCYFPRVDPTDPGSDMAFLHLDDFVAYKNSESVWIKSMHTLATNFRIAESGIGIIFASAAAANPNEHNEMLSGARIVGDTANKGEPAGEVQLPSGEVIQVDRSLPRTGSAQHAQIGVAFYRGPVHVVDTSFAGFQTNALRPAGAIGKKFSNPYFSSPIASVRNASFDFADPAAGSRFYDGDGTVTGYEERDGNRHNVLLDWDGSLTTYPRASLVRPIPLLMNARCVLLPNWGPGVGLCPDRFNRVQLGIAGNIPTFMTRNDLQTAETETALAEQQVSYSLNSAESYIMHFNTTVPARFGFNMYGVQQGLAQLVGVCVGANQELEIKPRRQYTLVNDMEEVLADESNSKYFYDPAIGVVVFRFTSQTPRTDATTSHCPGDLDEDGNGICTTRVIIELPAEHDDGDCRSRAYPAYATGPVSAEGALAVPVFA